MNQTIIRCQYQLNDTYIDLKLNLTIAPNVGDLYLYYDGNRHILLVAETRQIIETIDNTFLVVTFKKN